jgi:hypothetical protein
MTVSEAVIDTIFAVTADRCEGPTRSLSCDKVNIVLHLSENIRHELQETLALFPSTHSIEKNVSEY